MKNPKFLLLLTLANFLLLLFIFSETGSAAGGTETILKGNGLELSDAKGVIRAKINIEKDGEAVLRMFDETGTIRVKIGASAKGSGIVLLNDSTELGVQILTKDTGSRIKLVEKDGKEKIIKP